MEGLTFNDLINLYYSELVDSFTKISFVDILLSMLVTLFVSVIIFIVYKVTYRGVVYNNNFNISLVLMALIKTFVILTIISNVVLSRGMVGALSIVRFRSAVKDPIDIVFMFWAIGVGLTSGAGAFSVTIFASIIVAVVLLVSGKIKITSTNFVLVIKYNKEAEIKVKDILEANKAKLKSKSVSNGIVELTAEIKNIKIDTEITDEISSIDGVINSTLVKFQGDYSQAF